ncbi:class I SAM-dependent methyltransferase [Variovorax sp. J22P271]|uniref:methyltransferase regulatory domain-containing protein n=1 Tax=Variovorax davisae TaxID=3053515 RepID=UPI0025769FF0|nr:class I SAM-dependent methyltransferase [Variovorax sp. J22P271]MDM0034597.1 class I SAM-dependent methyltransferase [Variovorax sp. J22P271]
MDSSTTTLTSHSDVLSHDALPFPQSCPEQLEALAFLFGVRSPPPAGARVLELGCGAGANLIPFAARHPQAHAVGVDLSPARLKEGAGVIARARLMNIDLRAMDLADIDASFGQFDYIICHGLYSRVQPAMQEAILRVCAQNLAPDGVACVSYNVHPGWKARETVRDAMRLRGAPRDDPDEKLSYARGMLEFLAQAARPGSVLRATLDEALPAVRGASDAQLLHEWLAPSNAPCYFKQFVERADAHGLAYLADAEPHTMFAQNYSERVREPLMRQCGASQILMEQTLDFLVNRASRQTLLVRRERAGEIRYRLEFERLRALAYAGRFAADDGGVLALDGGELSCTGLREQKLTLRLPIHRAVAQVLDERFPATVEVDALAAEVSARIGEARAVVDPLVLAMLEELVILGAVRIRRTAPQVAAHVSPFPQAPAALRNAREVALSAGPAAAASNQWHEQVALSPLERLLLPLLDGRHAHEDLAGHLVAEAQAGRLRLIGKDDKPLAGDEALREFARQQVGFALRDLRRKALLTG